MRYVCLIYEDEKVLENMPKEEADAFFGEYFGFTEDIKTSGKYIAGEALQPVTTATSLRMRNGKLSTTDGPFAETKEQLGGFYLIEARDLDEALALGAACPGAKFGSIEVRPIVDFDAGDVPGV